MNIKKISILSQYTNEENKNIYDYTHAEHRNYVGTEKKVFTHGFAFEFYILD